MGQIHRSLEKELYQHGIYANLLNWRTEVKPVEWQMLNDTYDLFLTNPDAVLPLDRKSTRLNSSHVKRSRMPSSA